MHAKLVTRTAVTLSLFATATVPVAVCRVAEAVSAQNGSGMAGTYQPSAFELRWRGYALLRAGRYTEAIETLTRSIAIVPDAPAFNDCALAYYDLAKAGDVTPY